MNEKEISTKQKIIAIAIHLFKDEGYDAITIQDICDASGISKHTFYYHFDSKDKILHEFVKIPYDIRPDIMREILMKESPLEKYFTLLNPRMHYLEKLGGEILKQIIFFGFQKSEGEFQHNGSIHPMMEVECQLIKQAQECGEIRNRSSAQELSKMAIMITISTILRWALEPPQKPLKDFVYKNLFTLFDIEENMRKKLIEIVD